MKNQKESGFHSYVNHPRYGNKPIVSGTSYSREQIEASYWGYKDKNYFPETAIKADINKQNYVSSPRVLYVDIMKVCNQCKRPFIFFAQEQKYWYENLRFYIDTDCVKCVICRKKEQNIKKMFIEYEKLLKVENRTTTQTKNLKHIALKLYHIGYIKNRQKLHKII